jgi:hypothetical protein
MCLPFFHKYKVREQRGITRVNQTLVGFLYTLQCEKCGNIKDKYIILEDC